MSARTSKRITRSSCRKLENAKQPTVVQKKRGTTTNSNISKYQLMSEEQRGKKI